MARDTLATIKRIAVRTAVAAIGIVLILTVLVTWAWHSRPDIGDTGLHPSVAVAGEPAVTGRGMRDPERPRARARPLAAQRHGERYSPNRSFSNIQK